MSEPIPESIPTSADPRSKRPTKKRALTPLSQQASQIEALFAHPDREIPLPAGPVQRLLAAPPEIVANVQGSSAGAGSGEFHVYKASRRREYERVRMMEEEVSKEQADKEWQEKMEEVRRRDEQKRNKNKARRDKAKARQEKKKEGTGKANGAAASDFQPDPTARAHRDDTSSHNVDDSSRPLSESVAAIEEVGIIIHDED
ncbi:DUF1168-domain-containing protein [Trichodelitschia bisporula]|uniref:DUF1168-domain-containing protein n=1 Tax=Trichodelitschia bisporula TaxID=703511 RepID=A0A6G1HUI6_9PEZI|nr:DUF1168-domain-containing protein [Trichodelitschia bisporula]